MLTRYAQQDFTWIDLVSPSPEEVRSLVQEFSLDPRLSEELLVPSFRQKADAKDGICYVTLHFSALHSSGRRPEEEIDFIIAERFLITNRYEVNGPLHKFAKAFEVNSVLRHEESFHGISVFAGMMRNMYQTAIDECDALEHRLVRIEERIFGGAERNMVVEISHTGRAIHDLRQSLLPHRDVLLSLQASAESIFGPAVHSYMQELDGVYTHLEHALRNLREALVELRETNNSLLSTKQNEVMKTLTVLTFVFLPLLFITSIFSMNIFVPLIPFWVLFIAMAVIAGGALIYFKKKGWL